MIYLLETGLCLSLLYLAYWLFLRKETYFNFNRLFLVGSLILALIVPLVHMSFMIPQGSSLERPARNITKFRSGYEEMIRWIDADFGAEPGREHSVGNSKGLNPQMDERGQIPVAGAHGSQMENAGAETGKQKAGWRNNFSFSRILLFIYIVGVVYFLSRFIYLVVRLFLLAKRNRVTRQAGFRMVEIQEDISPFSFFRFLFINNRSLDESELDHVLEHEKAHIRQKHSMDHLFAHTLAIFQWFNPFAWQMRKALKTTHEYIADRQVLGKGIELFDYQSLLLKQVIGYHSVELVNNFNLKPIKKRIAMMNKTRSGMPAKLKAMLVVPFAMIIFFLFADFTLKGSSSPAAPSKELSGLWIKQGEDNFSKSLLIKDSRFIYSEGMEIRDYFLKTEGNSLILSEREGIPGTSLEFEQHGDELIIWWTDSQKSSYVKSKAGNTLDHYLEVNEITADLPSISKYRLLEENLVYRISYGKDAGGGTSLAFNGKSFTLIDLEELVQKEKNQVSKLDQNSLAALFLIDRTIPMVLVTQVRQEMRKINALHIAEGGYPHGDMDLSPLLYNTVGLPRLLPPLNAKILDKKEVEKRGGIIYTVDLVARNTTPRDVDEGLQQFIRTNKGGKYVISLEYDGAIPYGQYVEIVDMIVNVIYRFRNELSLEKYRVAYEQLGDELQREMRKAFPMALSESFVEN
jgi:hypothetical protein